jgi:hypothetical protein
MMIAVCSECGARFEAVTEEACQPFRQCVPCYNRQPKSALGWPIVRHLSLMSATALEAGAIEEAVPQGPARRS